MTVGQGPTALAIGAGGGCLEFFTLIYPFSPLSPSLSETARYRLKYCLKGPLNPKQPTNQPQMGINRERKFARPGANSVPYAFTICLKPYVIKINKQKAMKFLFQPKRKTESTCKCPLTGFLFLIATVMELTFVHYLLFTTIMKHSS